MSYVSGDKDSFPEHFQIKSLVMRIKTKIQPKLRSFHVPLTLSLPSSSCYLQVLGSAPTFSVRSVPEGLSQNQSSFTQHTALAHRWEKQQDPEQTLCPQGCAASPEFSLLLRNPHSSSIVHTLFHFPSSALGPILSSFATTTFTPLSHLPPRHCYFPSTLPHSAPVLLCAFPVTSGSC